MPHTKGVKIMKNHEQNCTLSKAITTEIVWDSNSNNAFLLREILEQFEGKTIKKIKVHSIETHVQHKGRLKPYYTVRLKFTDGTKFKFEIYLQQGVFALKTKDTLN